MRSFFTSLVLGLAWACFASSSYAEIITFDEPVNTFFHGFETQGFTFDVASGHYHLESSGGRFGMSTPTISLIIDDFVGSNSLSVSQGVFSLKSLDIASRSAEFGSTTVTIVGNLAGGGSVNHIYNDPDNSTFENLVLNWTGLTSVSFKGSGNSGSGENWYRLDNIDATAVPEPASLMLASLAGSVLCWQRRR